MMSMGHFHSAKGVMKRFIMSSVNSYFHIMQLILVRYLDSMERGGLCCGDVRCDDISVTLPTPKRGYSGKFVAKRFVWQLCCTVQGYLK